MEQSPETILSFKRVSRRTILKILGASGAAIASYLVAPTAWSKPNISAVTSLLLGDATDDIEISTTQDDLGVCQYAPGDSGSLLPLGASVAGSLSPVGPMGTSGSCDANFTTTFRSRYQLNLTSQHGGWVPGVGYKDKTGPWDFTWYRGQDNLYQQYTISWQPLGSVYRVNLTQQYTGGSQPYQGTIRYSGWFEPNATTYTTQLKHSKYAPQNLTSYYYYSKNFTITPRKQ